MKILMVTSEWPTPENPYAAPFIVRQFNYLVANGIEVDVFYFRGRGNPFNYLKAWVKCQKQLKSKKYDLIHAQWGQSMIPVLPKKIPIVVTFRGSDLEGVVNQKGKYGLKSIILKKISAWAKQFADHIIVVSPHFIEKLRNPNCSISVVPSGLEIEKIPQLSKNKAKEKYGLPKDMFTIIFPYSPSYVRKQFWLVKEAINRVPEFQRKKINLEVVFNRSHQEILERLIAADLLVFTSLHEGSPNVIKEAMACNLPIVSVPVGDVPLRLKGIAGCFVCNSYYADQIATNIVKAMNYDYSFFNSKKFTTNLDEKVLTKKVLSIYKKVLKNQ